mmetsp:Transcript_46277/g.95646  ORF Transcript_46277/g.95646 Transcript_46277/m.95646 type:complete len:104 (+) Transcript_46277:17-328(+)
MRNGSDCTWRHFCHDSQRTTEKVRLFFEARLNKFPCTSSPRPKREHNRQPQQTNPSSNLVKFSHNLSRRQHSAVRPRNCSRENLYKLWNVTSSAKFLRSIHRF